MKSLYFGERFADAVCSVSESLLFIVEEANETALFWRNTDVAEVVLGRLSIGPVGGNNDNEEDGILNADVSLKRLSPGWSSSSAKEYFLLRRKNLTPSLTIDILYRYNI